MPLYRPSLNTSFGRLVAGGGTVHGLVPGAAFIGTAGTRTLTANRAYYEQWIVETETTIDQVYIEVTTLINPSSIGIAIYNATSDGQPSSLVLDCGTVDSSSTGVKSITLGSPLVLPIGRYMVAFGSAAAPAVRVYRAAQPHLQLAMGATPVIQQLFVAGGYSGSWTNPGTAWTSIIGGSPEHAVIARASAVV